MTETSEVERLWEDGVVDPVKIAQMTNSKIYEVKLALRGIWWKRQKEMEDHIFDLLINHVHNLDAIAKHLGVSSCMAIEFMAGLEKQGKVWRSRGYHSRWFASSSWVFEKGAGKI